jgi:exocyst complex component 1
MIKSKMSKSDIAGSFWKAASAASVFKPRPGGAAERLRDLKRTNSGEGPDGITQVIPAPPRAKPEPEPPRIEEPPKPPEPPKSPERVSAVPEVKITVPNASRPSSSHSVLKEQQKKTIEAVKKATENREAAAVTGNDAKYLSTLGVDTSILAGQTAEFSKLLDHFGWIPGKKMRNRNFEEMKMDVDRQLNKAQAGDWVVRFEEEDDRIDAIKRGLDLAITECDELENLLTLYSVELSVS